MTCRLKPGDVLEVDDIHWLNGAFDKNRLVVKPIDGMYWWAKDRTGEWVPVMEEHYKPPGAIDPEK